MAQFEYAIGTVLKHEGGFVNNPRDPGGATNYGISLRYLKRQKIINGDLNQDGRIDVEDIKALKLGDALKMYQGEWTIYGYDRINDNEIAKKVFDMSVHMGQHQAILLAQRAVKDCDADADIFVDGIMGVYTVSGINDTNPVKLLEALRKRQADFYQLILDQHPFLKEDNENGWMNRAQS